MVGQYCCVKNCHSKSHDSGGKKLGNGISFYGFPTWKRKEGELVEKVTKRRRMAWIAAVRRSNVQFFKISASMKVCSLHFHSGQPAYEMSEAHPDWAPSLQLGHNEISVAQPEKVLRQSARDVKLSTQKEAEEMAHREAEERAQMEAECHLCRLRCDEINRLLEENAQLKRDLTADCHFCQNRHDEINRLLEENVQLKHELEEEKMTYIIF